MKPLMRCLECVGVAVVLLLVPMSLLVAVLVVVGLVLTPASEPHWPRCVKKYGGIGFKL